jgi:hypothetical protein
MRTRVWLRVAFDGCVNYTGTAASGNVLIAGTRTYLPPTKTESRGLVATAFLPSTVPITRAGSSADPG